MRLFIKSIRLAKSKASFLRTKFERRRNLQEYHFEPSEHAGYKECSKQHHARAGPGEAVGPLEHAMKSNDGNTRLDHERTTYG